MNRLYYALFIPLTFSCSSGIKTDLKESADIIITGSAKTDFCLE